MFQPNSPAAVEQATLSALNAMQQNISGYLQTCPIGSSPPVMGAWINGLDPFAWSLQQFAPVAAWLSQNGLPQMQDRLTFTLRDLSQARNTYIQMYQGMVNTQATLATIWSSAEQFATANILAATAYSVAVFDRWQQGMFDVMERNCYDCHRYIDIPGGGYCLDCARRRGLITW